MRGSAGGWALASWWCGAGEVGAAKDQFEAVTEEVIDGDAGLEVLRDASGDRGMPLCERVAVKGLEHGWIWRR